MDSGRATMFLADSASRRRFRVEHALRAVEQALLLLEPAPADGIEVRALERVREDLGVVLRTGTVGGR
jgi:hypothetical protein